MSVFVLDALRTPIAISYGAYNATTLKHLASPVIKTLLKANDVSITDVAVPGSCLGADVLFFDDFESGDTSAWSSD